VVPEYWTSKSTFFPVESTNSNFSLESKASLLGIGSSLMGQSTDSNSMEMITYMKSRDFSEDVIDKFNLVKYFEIEKKDTLLVKEIARRKLREEMLSFNVDEDTGLVGVSVTSKDRYLSAEIANYYISKLEYINQNQRNYKARLKKDFLKKRVKTVETTIDSLLLEIKEFQERTNLIELDNQVAKTVDMYSDLISKKITSELEYNIKKDYLEEDSFQLEKLSKQIEGYDNIIKNIEGIKQGQDLNYVIKLDNIPSQTLQLSNLKMKVKIQSSIYEFLYPQYEQAKIEELKDLPTIEILDRAMPAGKRTSPRRARFCIIVFLLSFIFISLAVYFYEIMKQNGQLDKLIHTLKK
jgi:uncharacterized protein involved in exopolysaccharide biosynthesis